MEEQGQTEISVTARYQHPNGAVTSSTVLVEGSVLAYEAAARLIDYYGGDYVRRGDEPIKFGEKTEED